VAGAAPETQMRKTMIAAVVLACALIGEARAQEHFTEGPVWAYSYYRIKPDREDAYLKFLRVSWLPQMVELKKAGLILDYKVFFNTARHDEKDWDLAFATLHTSYGKALDYSASDETKEKEIRAKQFKTKDEEKQREAIAPRLDFREYVGSRYVREVVLRPMP
jgi:hypothetical protein